MADNSQGGSRTLIVAVAGILILAGAWFFVVSPMMNSNSETAEAWNVQMSEDEHYEVTVRPALDPIALNQTHDWIVEIMDEDGTPVEGAEITVTGFMPAHGHGLPSAPQFTEYLGDGEYKVEGMQFQMPGDWEVDIAFAIDDHQHTVHYEFTLDT